MMPYALPPAETKLPLKALARVLLPGRHNFEEKLSRFLNAERCILANSARTLLYMVFLHLRSSLDRGQDEVLIPGYTCYSLPAAVVKAGLKVSLYDMNPATFKPDFEDVRRKISGRTMAVVGQHLLGVDSDISKLAKLASEKGIFCIDDSAQLFSNGWKKDDKSAADYTIYSFGRGKPLPLGSGGLLVSYTGREINAIRSRLIVHPSKNGRSLMPLAVRILSNPAFYWSMEKLPLGLGRTIYDPGFPVSGMSRFYQRLGEYALNDFERLNRHRSMISKIYADHLEPGNAFRNKTAVSSPHVRYPLLADSNKRAEDLVNYGVRRMYPRALCDLEPLREHLTGSPAKTPGAREISRRLVTLPTHQRITEKMAIKIANEAIKVLGGITLVTPDG